MAGDSGGPYFGKGANISVSDNSNKNTDSYVNASSSYNLPKHANGNSTINGGEQNFQVREIEVYKVTI